MTDEQKILEIANTLKKHGLAASMMEAMERARSIVELTTKHEEKEKLDFDRIDIDISKTDKSINELMVQAGVADMEIKEMARKEQEQAKELESCTEIKPERESIEKLSKIKTPISVFEINLDGREDKKTSEDELKDAEQGKEHE